MDPNVEQIKSALRWAVTTFGGFIGGWFAAKGWFTIDQVAGVLNSPTVLSATASILVFIWGLLVHSKTNIVATANALPEVAGVITQPTQAGQELAAAVPSITVVPAGTIAAVEIAKPQPVKGP